VTLDADLAREWLRVERSLTGDLSRVARNLVALRARGINVNTWLMGADPGYLQLVAQLGTEARRFGDTAATEIAREAARRAGLSQSQVRAYLKQIGAADYRSVTPRSDGFVDRQAAYRFLLDSGVPADALAGMRKAMLEAAQAGKSPAEVVAAAKAGMARGLNRAMLTSRDQTARAAREAADLEMQASGQVWQKQRIVQRDGACAACLAKDGEVIPVEEPSFDHAAGKCQWKPILVGQNALRRSAETWLRTQPAEYQRDVLGNARYEAFRDGKLSLASVGQVTQHPTWGRGLRIAPMAQGV